MEKTEPDHPGIMNLSGFYHFLQHHYRCPERRVRGIIACTGVILNKVQDLTMSRSDLERIRRYIRGIGLTGEAMNFYLLSFTLYMLYIESARNNRRDAI